MRGGGALPLALRPGMANCSQKGGEAAMRGERGGDAA